MNNGLSQLEKLREQGVLSSLDLHFARFVCRLGDDSSSALALGAALVSNRTAGGHVCLDLRAEAGRVLDQDGLVRTPEVEPWQALLRESPVVGRPGELKPLVLDPAGRLYLYRYWEYERELVAALRLKGGSAVDGVDEKRLQAGLSRLFSIDPETRDQKLAAATAVMQRFCVISGGPGTGKTSAVVRILALLRQQPDGEQLNIALVAPTGKAAARVQESIRAAKQALPLDTAVLDRIPDQASTIHRLLGGTPDSVYFQYDRDSPLPLDVLILDEASMVDIALMAKLLQALPISARLILLGDKDQLASVEAGAVLADICAGATGFSKAYAQRLEKLVGGEIPVQAQGVSPITDAIVTLGHNFRFGEQSGIGRLARAVNEGEGEQVLALLEDVDCGDVAWISQENSLAEQAAAHYRAYLTQMGDGAPAEALFESFNRFRLLSAVRKGEWGVETLNREIELVLEKWGLIDTRRGQYAGRPIMITRNDYGLGLYNGDTGLLLPNPQDKGHLEACFMDAAGEVRRLPPARLPAHETVFAMTAHKSQGSEFDQVLLVLPQRESAVLSRELLYTGITRARSAFEIHAEREVLISTIRKRQHRATGLQEGIWGR